MRTLKESKNFQFFLVVDYQVVFNMDYTAGLGSLKMIQVLFPGYSWFQLVKISLWKTKCQITFYLYWNHQIAFYLYWN